MSEKMTVLYVQPGKYPEVHEVTNDLETLQGLVDGLIQTVYPWEDPVAIVCNDEGKLMGLPLNRPLGDYDVLAGNFFICGLGREDFRSLTEDEIKKYEEMYHDPVYFAQSPIGTICAKCTPEQYNRMMQREQTKEMRSRSGEDR